VSNDRRGIQESKGKRRISGEYVLRNPGQWRTEPPPSFSPPVGGQCRQTSRPPFIGNDRRASAWPGPRPTLAWGGVPISTFADIGRDFGNVLLILRPDHTLEMRQPARRNPTISPEASDRQHNRPRQVTRPCHRHFRRTGNPESVRMIAVTQLPDAKGPTPQSPGHRALWQGAKRKKKTKDVEWSCS